MKESETFFSSYSKEYVVFAHLIIYDYSKNKFRTSSAHNYFCAKKKIIVKFKSENISARILVVLFSKNNKKRKKMEIKDVYEAIQTNFLNLAECRSYDIFKEKYYESFKNEFDELMSSYKKDIFYFYEISNNDYIFSSDFKIFNPDKEDYYLSKIINTDECTLNITIAKKQ